jgi:hypothetical protein
VGRRRRGDARPSGRSRAGGTRPRRVRTRAPSNRSHRWSTAPSRIACPRSGRGSPRGRRRSPGRGRRRCRYRRVESGRRGARLRRPAPLVPRRSCVPEPARERRQAFWRDRLGNLRRRGPAIETTVAWSLFPPDARYAYRDALEIDDATWARGKGWVLTGAFGIPYYRHTNPVLVADKITAVEAILADST